MYVVKFIQLACVVCFLATGEGCVCRDGGFVYNTSARVVYESGNPVFRARVAGEVGIWPDSGDIETLVNGGFETTDADGRVTVKIATADAWGGCGRREEAPVPENPETLMLYIEYPHGRVFSNIFLVTDDMITARRSGELDIDVGETVIPRYVTVRDTDSSVD